MGANAVHGRVEILWVNWIHAYGAGAPIGVVACLSMFDLILVFVDVVVLVYFFSLFVCNVHISLLGVPSPFSRPVPAKTLFSSSLLHVCSISHPLHCNLLILFLLVAVLGSMFPFLWMERCSTILRIRLQVPILPKISTTCLARRRRT